MLALAASAAGAQPVRQGAAGARDRPAALAGGRVQLSKLRGRPVVVSFWGTYCLPCRTEFPELVRAHAEHAAAGLHVLGVNERDQEWSTKDVKKFVDEFAVPFPVALDQRGRSRQAYRVRRPAHDRVHRLGRRRATDPQRADQPRGAGPRHRGDSAAALTRPRRGARLTRRVASRRPMLGDVDVRRISRVSRHGGRCNGLTRPRLQGETHVFPTGGTRRDVDRRSAVNPEETRAPHRFPVARSGYRSFPSSSWSRSRARSRRVPSLPSEQALVVTAPTQSLQVPRSLQASASSGAGAMSWESSDQAVAACVGGGSRHGEVSGRGYHHGSAREPIRDSDVSVTATRLEVAPESGERRGQRHVSTDGDRARRGRYGAQWS